MDPAAVVGIVVVISALIVLGIDRWQAWQNRKAADQEMEDLVQTWKDRRVIEDMEKHWNETYREDR